MKSERLFAACTGSLFLLATASGILSVVFTGETSGSAAEIALHEKKLILGVFFQFVMAFSCIGIPLAMYPVLKRYSEGLALGSTCFRLAEGILHVVNALVVVALVALCTGYVKNPAAESAAVNFAAEQLIEIRHWSTVPGLMAWCIGALMYYLVFYRSKLIPRWLSLWGIIAVVPAMVATLLTLFRVSDSMTLTDTLLNIPIGIQELVLAIWLLARGFNSSLLTGKTGTVPLQKGTQ